MINSIHNATGYKFCFIKSYVQCLIQSTNSELFQSESLKPDNITILNATDIDDYQFLHRPGNKISVHIASMWEPTLTLSDFSFILRGEPTRIDFNSKEIGAKEGYLLSYHLDPARSIFQPNAVITEWTDIQTLVELQLITVSTNSPELNADAFIESWKASSSTKGNKIVSFMLEIFFIIIPNQNR